MCQTSLPLLRELSVLMHIRAQDFNAPHKSTAVQRSEPTSARRPPNSPLWKPATGGPRGATAGSIILRKLIDVLSDGAPSAIAKTRRPTVRTYLGLVTAFLSIGEIRDRRTEGGDRRRHYSAEAMDIWRAGRAERWSSLRHSHGVRVRDALGYVPAAFRDATLFVTTSCSRSEIYGGAGGRSSWRGR